MPIYDTTSMLMYNGLMRVIAKEVDMLSKHNYMMTSSNGNIFRVTGPFVRGINRSLVASPHKGQLHGALMFSLICVWTNVWANNRDDNDFRRHRVHCDVTVMNYNKTVRSRRSCTDSITHCNSLHNFRILYERGNVYEFWLVLFEFYQLSVWVMGWYRRTSNHDLNQYPQFIEYGYVSMA